MASAGASTVNIFARMVATAPAISSTVSPRTRSAIRSPPICAGVASPDIILSKACAASSRVSAAPVAALPISVRKRSIGSLSLLRVPLRCEVEEVLQNDLAMLGGDALRMKLHAVHGMRFMRKRNHNAVGGLRRDLEIFWHRLALHHKRMITRCFESIVDAVEHAFAVMLDLRELPVHWPCAHNVAAISGADCLMAETDAEDRRGCAEAFHEFERNSRVVRRAGTGRDHDRIGVPLFKLVDRNLVVAVHLHLGPEHAEGMDEIPGEAVIVIDER